VWALLLTIWYGNTTTVVAEGKGTRVPFFTLKGRVLKVEEDAEVFGADGRLVARLRRGQAIRLKPGVYFVRMHKGTARVVVR